MTSPAGPDDDDRNDDDRNDYDRDGYLVVGGVFDAGTLDELERAYDRIVAQLLRSGDEVNARWDSAARYEGAEELVVLHTHQVQNYSAAWLRALQAPAFLDVVESLIGPDIVLHHTKLFQKPPGHGAPFPMHQDWRYFPTEHDSMMAAVIHLSDASDDMGCFRVYPGSHRIGRRPSTSGRLRWDDPDAFRSFSDEYPLDGATPVEARRGDVLFFSSLTVHGSGPNVSDRVRKNVLVQLHAGTDVLDPDADHIVSGIVLRGWNHAATRSSFS
ncbi:MAG: phytanoyl-CoA dioxygenase family protein [Actinomycetota bacterium]